MSDIAIRVEQLGKAYRIGLKEDIPDTLVGAVTSWAKAPVRNLRRLSRLNTFTASQGADHSDTIWALRDVSFEVREGEVVGVIGRNGAGKSTLLKILSRITEPTTGRATIYGRVSSLLEVGTGFHPELTGRENVYMNGTILGMTKREIDRKFDQIVDFSGIEKFIDTPVKRYSSGMKVRLAFSVAAHLEPEILIIDEVLAVGDFEFQKKCLGKMHDVATGGRTVLFVSHNMAAVEALCSDAILLDQGSICSSGPVGQVSAIYLNPTQLSGGASAGVRYREGQLISQIRLLNGRGECTESIAAGTDAHFEITVTSRTPLSGLTLRLVISTTSGIRLCNCNSRIETNRLFDVHGSRTIHCILRDQRLAPGRYVVSVHLFAYGRELDGAEPALSFTISSADVFGTGKLPSHSKALYLPLADWSFGATTTSCS